MTRKVIRYFSIMVCLVFLAILGVLVGREYIDYWESKQALEVKTIHLREIEREVVQIQRDLDKYELEKTGFRELLFEEKDVPAFLDGISLYADKSAVNIQDMKTQRFREVSTSRDSRSIANKRRSKNRKNK